MNRLHRLHRKQQNLELPGLDAIYRVREVQQTLTFVRRVEPATKPHPKVSSDV